MKLKQGPCCPPHTNVQWPYPSGVAQGQAHEYGGKGLSGEKVLEKSLIIELGWARPVSFFSCPNRLLPLRDVAMGRESQLLWRLKPRSAPGPRLLRLPLRRVHMPQSDEARAQTHWAHLTQPLYKKPGAGQADRARPEAPRLTVPHPLAFQPSHVPLFIVSLDCRVLFWALGDKRELTTVARSPHGGQVGVRAALLVTGQLLPSLQPLPCPLETSKYNSLNSQHMCVWNMHPCSGYRLQREMFTWKYVYMLVAINGPFMETNLKSILKDRTGERHA